MNTMNIEEIVPAVVANIESAVGPKAPRQYNEALIEGLKYMSDCVRVYAEIHSVVMRNESLLKDFEKYCVLHDSRNCTWAELSDIQKEQVRRIWAYAVTDCWQDIPSDAYHKKTLGAHGKTMLVHPSELWGAYLEWRASGYPGATQREGAKPMCLCSLVDFIREHLVDMPGFLSEDVPAITKYAIRVYLVHALTNN